MRVRRADIALLLAAVLTHSGLLAAAEPAHAPEPDGYWTGAINGPVPATLQGARVIHAHTLAGLSRHGHVVVVDVSNLQSRPEGLGANVLWSVPPHTGIPGSHWIPGVGRGELTQELDAYFRLQLRQLTGDSLDRPVAIYCHERCWLSWNAAKRAVGYGYRHIYWFPDGIEGWRAAGLPTAVISPTGPDG